MSSRRSTFDGAEWAIQRERSPTVATRRCAAASGELNFGHRFASNSVTWETDS